MPSDRAVSRMRGSARSVVTSTETESRLQTRDDSLPGELGVVGQQHHPVGALQKTPFGGHLDRRCVEHPAVRVDAAGTEKDRGGVDLAQAFLGEHAHEGVVSAV